MARLGSKPPSLRYEAVRSGGDWMKASMLAGGSARAAEQAGHWEVVAIESACSKRHSLERVLAI